MRCGDTVSAMASRSRRKSPGLTETLVAKFVRAKRAGSVSSVADPVAFGPLFLDHTEVCITMTAGAAPRSNP